MILVRATGPKVHETGIHTDSLQSNHGHWVILWEKALLFLPTLLLSAEWYTSYEYSITMTTTTMSTSRPWLNPRSARELVLNITVSRSQLYPIHCPVLFCSVLSCSVLFCSVLSCSVLSCSVLSCSVLSCPVPVLLAIIMILITFVFPVVILGVQTQRGLSAQEEEAETKAALAEIMAAPHFRVRLGNEAWKTV